MHHHTQSLKNPALYVQSFTFNAFAEKTYVVYDDTKACAIVDPGCYERREQEALSTFIQKNNLQVTHLINTHAHIDHIVGNPYIQATYGVQPAVHHQEIPVLQAAIEYAATYGFSEYKPVEPQRLLSAGDVIPLGQTTLAVLHIPGHSPGHIALYSQAAQLCFSGDVLFRKSIGITDLPGGDATLLIQSIHKQLFLLGDEVTIYPGHGPATTIGKEKRTNPFCQL